LDRLIQAKEDYALSFINSTSDDANTSTLRGHLFAGLALRLLRRGFVDPRPLRWRRLTPRHGAAKSAPLEEGKLTYAARADEHKYFSSVDELTKLVAADTVNGNGESKMPNIANVLQRLSFCVYVSQVVLTAS
jgi:hypothetical protein